MKNLIVLILALTASLASGQRFDGHVVTNANDTIKCKFFVATNSINRSIFQATSVYSKVKILTDKGEEITYYPKDIKSFYIEKTSQGDMKFVGIKEDGFQHFYHEVVGDRLSYYKLYHKSGGMHPNAYYKEFVYKDGILLELGTKNTRKNFGDLIRDNKELYDYWIDPKGYYKVKDAFIAVNQYNRFFKEKEQAADAQN
jgi:hypothetical protein